MSPVYALRDALAELFPALTTDEAAACLAVKSALTEAIEVLETMPPTLHTYTVGLALLSVKEALHHIDHAAQLRSLKHGN